MPRRLFTLFSALSLLLSVAVVVLWVRSYRSTDTLYRYWPSHYVTVVSRNGAIEIRRFEYAKPVPRSPEQLRLRHVRGMRVTTVVGESVTFDRLGLGRFRFTSSSGAFTLDIYVIRWWHLLLPVAIPPALLLGVVARNRVRCRRRVAGLCPRCGYDLRATPGRCPECGTSAAANET
jgi:hypothetical protein